MHSRRSEKTFARPDIARWESVEKSLGRGRRGWRDSENSGAWWNFRTPFHRDGRPPLIAKPGLNMLSLLRAARSPRPLLQTSRCAAYARYFATEISDNASRDGAVNTSAAKEVVPELEIDEQQDLYDRPQRPPHGVTIDPNHGLYAFFRAFQQPDGQWERLTAQPKSAEDGYSGVYIYHTLSIID